MFNIKKCLFESYDFVLDFLNHRKKHVPQSRPNRPENVLLPTPTPIPTRSNFMKFYYNDPTYVNLIGTVENPKPDGLCLSVSNLIPGDHSFDSTQGLACNTYAILCHGINMFNKLFNLKKWAAVNCLTVFPAAGVQANAYYDRTNLKFFYFDHKGKRVYTALSADIVLHELGHGLLDAIRPDFFSSASMETWAFHESFGDVTSIISALHFDPVVDKLLADTNGNLRQPNIVASVAEQFGTALGMVCGLREAFNNFKYQNPASLPKQASGPDMIYNEPHSFSKIMTGIVYDVLCSVYEKNGSTKEALFKARDYVKETFYKSCVTVPNSANFYECFCEAWLQEDLKQSVSHKEILIKVFQDRAVLRMSKMSEETVDAKEKIVINMDNDSRLEKCKAEMSVKDLYGDSFSAMSIDEEIGNMVVELAVDDMYIRTDMVGWQKVSSPLEEAKDAAKNLLEYIISNNLFGKEETSVWFKNDDNKLTRRMFECDCYSNNCKIPGNPEYGKCWKSKNNTGCCTYGSCANSESENSKKVEKTCNIRYSSSCRNSSYNSKCY
jgi:hypothetical protein